MSERKAPINPDDRKLKPMKFYDRSAWWNKTDGTSTAGGFGVEDSIDLMMKQVEVVDKNSKICHDDRLKLHRKYGRTFVTPPFHGLGGHGTMVMHKFIQQQEFYTNTPEYQEKMRRRKMKEKYGSELPHEIPPEEWTPDMVDGSGNPHAAAAGQASGHSSGAGRRRAGGVDDSMRKPSLHTVSGISDAMHAMDDGRAHVPAARSSSFETTSYAFY